MKGFIVPLLLGIFIPLVVEWLHAADCQLHGSTMLGFTRYTCAAVR